MPAVPKRSTKDSEKPAFQSTDADAPIAARPGDAMQSDLLARYGITAVPGTTYEWGGFRYTNAHDAIAAAKRGASE